MQGFDWEILTIAVLTAVGCALPGNYLVLRRMSLMSDAISHAILLGIVLAFFVAGSLDSPLLMLGAAATGLLTVALVELLHRTQLVKEDTAVALVFPSLFSAGVLLIALYAGNIHLDVDAVLLGELAFAPFDRVSVADVDLGPRALWISGSITVLNGLLVWLYYKELELATFDAALAASLGFAPALLHYGLMATVSITAVGAFDAVGSVLVVALMIVPAACAYLLTQRLHAMILLSLVLAVAGAVTGYAMARALDASIAGSMATTLGLEFLLVYLLAPQRGLIAAMLQRAGRRREFAQAMLLIHLLNHEGTEAEAEECRLAGLENHLGWSAAQARRVAAELERQADIQTYAGLMQLTALGRERARHKFVELL